MAHRSARRRQRIGIAALACALATSMSVASVAQDTQPADAGAVEAPSILARLTDLSGAVPDLQDQQLMDAAMASLVSTTGSQLIVLLVPTVGAEPLEDFGARVRVASPLAITASDVLLVVATDDDQAALLPGPALKDTLTLAERLIIADRDVRPAVAAQDWRGTVIHTARGLRAAILDEPLQDVPRLVTPIEDRAGRLATASGYGLAYAALGVLPQDTGGHRLWALLLPTTGGEPLDGVMAMVLDQDRSRLGPGDALLVLVDDEREARLWLGAELAAQVPLIEWRLLWSRDIRPALLREDWSAAIVGAAAGLHRQIDRDSMCLITPDELSTATGVMFVAAQGTSLECVYQGDPALGEFALVLGFGQMMDETSLSSIRQTSPAGGRDVDVGGFPGWLSDEGIWVDLGEDVETGGDGWDLLYGWESVVLTAQPILDFLPDPPDVRAILPAIADLAVSRLLATPREPAGVAR